MRKISLIIAFFVLFAAQGQYLFADSSVEAEWSKTFAGAYYARSVRQTSDSGYIVAGSTSSLFGAVQSDVRLIKTDSNGNEVWDKAFGGSGKDYACSVQETSGSGYIVVGYTNSFGAGSDDVWLIKTDSLGNKLWDKTFGGSSGDIASSVQQTSDGGYIIVGDTYSFGTGTLNWYLIKIDSSGNELWYKTFSGLGRADCTSVQQTSDGGYIIAGSTALPTGSSEDLYLVKTDSNGGTLWEQTFGGSGNDFASSVRQTSDGGYIVAGYTVSFGAGGADVWIIKTNSLGNKIWDKTFGGSNADGASSVQQTSDGGYIVAGHTQSFGAGNEDAWLIKTDSLGNKLWDKTFGGSINDWASSVQQTSDGGYIMTGCTASLSGAVYNAWLLKVKASPVSPTILVSSNGKVIVNFGSQYGIWIYDGEAWSQLHTVSPKSMAAGNLDSDPKKDLIIDFGSQYGIWIYSNGSTWTQLHALSAKSIVTADLDNNGQDEIIVDFGSTYGIWAYYNNLTWTQLHTLSADSITPAHENGDHILCIDFGPSYGIWNWHPPTGKWPNTWSQMHAVSPEIGVAADIDNDGNDEGIIDFGPSYGVWICYNNSNWGTWTQFHNISPESITVGNIDSDPKKDLIIDFGPSYGIWVYANNSNWSQLHSASADSITTGDMNGNGIDEVIVDFGPAYGIWVHNDDGSWWQLHTVSP